MSGRRRAVTPPAAVAATLGLGGVKAPMAAPIALNLDGAAITVSLRRFEEIARLADGDIVIVLGGPAMLIGLGGGAAGRDLEVAHLVAALSSSPLTESRSSPQLSSNLLTPSSSSTLNTSTRSMPTALSLSKICCEAAAVPVPAAAARSNSRRSPATGSAATSRPARCGGWSAAPDGRRRRPGSEPPGTPEPPVQQHHGGSGQQQHHRVAPRGVQLGMWSKFMP